MRFHVQEPDSEPKAGDAVVPEPIPAFSLAGSLSPLLLVPIAVLVLIALLAPEDVLDQVPVARSLTEWLQTRLPFIDRHAASSRYPQLALLVNCLTVSMVPLLSIVWIVQSSVNYPRLLARNRALQILDLKTHLFILFFLVPILLGALYVMVGIPGDPSWADGFTTTRRGGLAFMSGLMLYLSALGLGGWPLAFRLFIDLHLRGRAKR